VNDLPLSPCFGVAGTANCWNPLVQPLPRSSNNFRIQKDAHLLVQKDDRERMVAAGVGSRKSQEESGSHVRADAWSRLKAIGTDVRRVLHIEGGREYGGSIKELELYLRNADWRRFDHSVLFYYPTPGRRLLEELAKTSVLPQAPSTKAGGCVRWPSFSFLAKNQLISDVVDVIRARAVVGELVRFMQREPPDLVHINNTFTHQPASILAAARVGIPIVAHVRNPVKFTAATKMLARRVATFVAVNPRLVESLDGRPVRLVCDSVEVNPPRAEAVRQMRQMLGGEGLLVGSVGRLDEQKGYEYLVRAAKIVCQARPDALFVIAGDGPSRSHLQMLIDSLGLSNRFRLLGFRTDPEVVTAALDIFVCSSLFEGTPLTVIDAMSLGIPTVSTPVGVVPEVIIDRRTGWLVEPGNAEALARGIIDASTLSAEVRCQVAGAAKSAAAPFRDVKGLARQFEETLCNTGPAAGTPAWQ
jgi:glycosyltransferase involved in cell wall biosynthesis